MQPGTRYTLEVNPRIPEAPRAAGGARGQPLVQLGPADARAVRAPESGAVGRGRPQPEGDAEAHRRAAPARRRRRPGVPRQPDARARGVRRVSRRAAVPAERRRLPARTTWSPTSAPSSACTRACRSIPAASASSPATTARRRATSSCRSSRVGLLYRQGYFVQTIDAEGRQRAEYHDSDFGDLPIDAGAEGRRASSRSTSRSPAATCTVKVWQARVGHVTALPARHRPAGEQPSATAHIAHRLYGGDRTTRLEQEIVLGVGGARALAAMGLKPTVWHINEGHAAFLILERVRALVREGLPFDAGARGGGVEHGVHHAHAGAGGPRPVRRRRWSLPYLKARLRRARTSLPLGRPPAGGDFNMTALALRGSRYHNGVSRIHGGVSARLLQDLAAGHAGGKPDRLRHQRRARRRPSSRPSGARCSTASSASAGCTASAIPASGKRSATSPTTSSGACARTSRRACCTWCATASRVQHARNHGSESHLERLLRFADPANPNVLTIGFGAALRHLQARDAAVQRPRQAARASLGDTERPVLFLFAGKAHPGRRARPGADPHAGAHVAARPEFQGRAAVPRGLRPAHRAAPGLGRRRVAEQPGASARSLRHLGHEGRHERRDQPLGPRRLVGRGLRRRERLGDQARLASRSTRTGATARKRARSTRSCRTASFRSTTSRAEGGYSPEWIRIAKRSMASLLPRYDASRMLGEYVSKYYLPASRQGHRYAERRLRRREDSSPPGRRGCAPRGRAWLLRRLDTPKARIQFGDTMRVEVAVKLNGLAPGDVVRRAPARARPARIADGAPQPRPRRRREAASGEQKFTLDLKPGMSGRLDYRIRVVPRNELLTHPLELGLCRVALEQRQRMRLQRVGGASLATMLRGVERAVAIPRRQREGDRLVMRVQEQQQVSPSPGHAACPGSARRASRQSSSPISPPCGFSQTTSPGRA